MGIINASLTRYVANHPELRPAPAIDPSPLMTEHERSARVAELDSLIAELQSELDATPNRLWQHAGTQFRLTSLIRYTAQRRLLSL